MDIILNDLPHVLERGNRVYFIESRQDSRRRVINLDRIEYIEFAPTIQYDSEEKVFTTRLQYEGAKFHLFADNNACVLYDYFMG